MKLRQPPEHRKGATSGSDGLSLADESVSLISNQRTDKNAKRLVVSFLFESRPHTLDNTSGVFVLAIV